MVIQRLPAKGFSPEEGAEQILDLLVIASWFIQVRVSALSGWFVSPCRAHSKGQGRDPYHLCKMSLSVKRVS